MTFYNMKFIRQTIRNVDLFGNNNLYSQQTIYIGIEVQLILSV